MSIKLNDVVLLLTLVGLGACSVVEERQQAYRQAESASPLVIPASLDAPNTERALLVPQVGEYAPPSAEPPSFEQIVESDVN